MSDSGVVHSLVKCHDCGREFYEGNRILHQLRSCRARARRPGDDAKCNNEEPKPMEVEETPQEPATDRTSIVTIDSVDDESDNDSDIQVVELPRESAEAIPSSRSQRVRDQAEASLPGTPQGGLRRRRRRLDGDNENPQTAETEIVDLVEDTPSSQAPAESDGPGENQWACSHCTLYNSNSDEYCAACRMPNANRRPDPIRRGRLVRDRSEFSPAAFVGGGALMGGILGAAGSFVHGRDPFSAAAEGAMTGVMGGAFLNEVMASRQGNSSGPMELGYMEELLANSEANHRPMQQGPMNVAQARSSASITGGYPSMEGSTNNYSGNGRTRPRSSFRVVQEQGNDGTSTTTVLGGNSTTRIRRSTGRTPGGTNDPMLSFLLHSMLESEYRGDTGGLPTGNVDGNEENMSYEELLQAFGDGTDNLGATDTQIASLPTRVVENLDEELPEDARQCLICLEDIAAGETRKILPCLHGFHGNCCDKWLQNNGSCPICKHRVAH